jgi:hypothetical protein
LIANILGVETNSPEVSEFNYNVVRSLDPDGYKFIGLVYQHTQPSRLAMAIVLEIGEDPEELEKAEVSIDSTIAAALPHVLVGPGVWELWD